ncbi:MAG: type II secretion system protein [Rickettsiales bacterium]|nr:type II secretion system protein [Rickettsiales bacterium]
MKLLNKYKNFAFSLIELSIVILILSVVVSSAMNVMGDKKISETNIKTEEKLKHIAKALKIYAKENNRLPCPMDIGLTPTSASFGSEELVGGDPSDCDGGYNNNLGTFVGFVPFAEIGLPPEYLYDEWGRLISYYMDESMASAMSTSSNIPNIDVKNLTSSGSENTIMWRYVLTSEVGSNIPDCRDAGASTISASSTNVLIPVCAAYALVSHGANGYKSINLAGTELSGANGSTREANNAPKTHDGSNAHIKILALPFNNSSESSYANYFDDIVVYMSKEAILDTQFGSTSTSSSSTTSSSTTSSTSSTSSGSCTPVTVNYGEACDAECLLCDTGLTCSSGTCACTSPVYSDTGGPCDNECQLCSGDNVCTANVCVCTPTYVSLDEDCDAECKLCDVDLFCKDAKCSSCLGDGSPCTSSSECCSSSPYCISDGKCSTESCNNTRGDSCSIDKDCCSPYGKCTEQNVCDSPTCRALNDGCVSTSDCCFTLTCEEGTCR